MYVEDGLAFTQVNVIMWLEPVYMVRLLISDDNHMIAVVSVLIQCHVNSVKGCVS